MSDNRQHLSKDSQRSPKLEVSFLLNNSPQGSGSINENLRTSNRQDAERRSNSGGTSTGSNRRYRCDACPAAFAQSHDLAKHKRYVLLTESFNIRFMSILCLLILQITSLRTLTLTFGTVLYYIQLQCVERSMKNFVHSSVIYVTKALEKKVCRAHLRVILQYYNNWKLRVQGESSFPVNYLDRHLTVYYRMSQFLTHGRQPEQTQEVCSFE